MKKFLLKIALFAFVFFIIDKAFYYFLFKAPKVEYDKRLEKVINRKLNKDLIVIGSSRGAGNIISSQIEKQTKLTSYNLSYPGSNVLFHEFILKTIVKHNQKPKIILLAIDNPYEFIEEKSLVFRFDRLYPLSKYNYINQELIDKNERNILSYIFCLARLNKTSFSLNKISEPIENPILPCGSMPFVKKTANTKLNFSNTMPTYTQKNELPEKIAAFKRIQSTCKKNKIQLFFVFSPNYHKFNTNFVNRFQTLLLPENKMIIYNQNNPIYKNQSYFFDVSHLMKNGAEIFTTEISQNITNFIKK